MKPMLKLGHGQLHPTVCMDVIMYPCPNPNADLTNLMLVKEIPDDTS